jgi:hypothetical protein
VVLHGQIGTLVLLVLALAWNAWKRKSSFLVGVALGSLVFKPPMSTIGLCAAVLAPGWRLWVGLVCGTLLQILATIAIAGTGPLIAYWGAVKRIAAMPAAFEPKLWQMHSLRGAVELVAGQGRLAFVIWIVASLGVLWLARRAYARLMNPELRFSVIALAGMLLDPHLYVYDLVILLVPLALIASWYTGARRTSDASSLATVAFGLFWAPLIGPFASLTHVQLTSPAMVYLLWRLGRPLESITVGGEPSPPIADR